MKSLSRTVKEIEGNLNFAIFGKNSKIQNGRHFWGGENFLKIAKITFLRYPVGQKFRRNRSISHKIFGKLQRLHSLDTLWVENFDEITISHS